MTLESLIGVSPTWALTLNAEGGGIVGPFSPGGSEPGLTITLIQPSDVPSGVPTERRHIRENAQDFDVVYHDFANYQGLWHERGQNWLLWTKNMKRIFISEGPEDSARRWVHIRFILRHFILRHLLSLSGYRRLHAVAGPCVGAAHDAGILIAGPFLSGKTYLIHKLIEQGMVSELVEDDCAVVDADWQLHCLIPDEHEVQQMRRLPIRGMVCLDPQVQTIDPLESYAAAAWALGIQGSWPLLWLPDTPAPVTSLVSAPPFPSCLKMPYRPPIEEAIAAIRELVTALAAP